MSVINVKLERLDQESDSIIKLARALRDYNETVGNISLELSMDILARKRLDLMLRKVHDQILNEAAKMETLGGALAKIAQSYRATETKLIGLCDTKRSSPVRDSSQAERLADKADNFIEDLRYTLVNIGISKAERQERAEGTPVSERQEHEMDLYMRQQVAKLNKDPRFSKKTWKKASVEERKEILQDYIAQISTIMGLPPVTIRWDDEEEEDGYATMGYYSPSSNSITINEWVLREGDKNGFPSYNLVSTVVHEMRHYYQQEAVRDPDQYVVSEETIQAWEDSINNYKSTEEFMEEDGMSKKKAYKAYKDQEIESDARWFAKQK